MIMIFKITSPISTGIGHALALSLDDLGVQVFAGCRNTRTEGALVLQNKASDRMHVLQCDVTKMDDVTKCREHVEKHLGKNGTYMYMLTYFIY